MADDGMLMNFSVGDAPLKAAVAFKGGRWRDRLAAKKSSRRDPEAPHARKIFSRSYDASKEEYIGASPRPAKRIRVEDDSGAGPRTDTPRFNEGRSAASKALISGKLPPGSIGTGKGKKQVISSLFSFNPTSKTTFAEAVEPAEAAKPSNAPLSEEMASFVSLGLSARVAGHLSTKLELKAPTAIQKAAVPQMMNDDSDAFIQAQTGSGKTLAYLLPIVDRIVTLSANEGSPAGEAKINRGSGLFAIVLAPTRELCKQISAVLEKLLRCAPWIVGTTVIGGESKKSEKARLRKGVNILIATPGRLADHLDHTEVLNVSTVRWLVLDEGDRLMEMGFEEEIKGIVDKIRQRPLATTVSSGRTAQALPARRVTVLCSATIQMNVQRLGEISLKDAVHIQAEPSEAAPQEEKDQVFSAPDQLRQSYAVIPAKLRLVALNAFLKRTFARRGSTMKAIVFISCADSVDFHFSVFSRPGPKSDDVRPDAGVDSTVSTRTDLTKDTQAPATAFSHANNHITMYKLHGSLPQNVRTATLKAFATSPEPGVLFCTDVASRGLDLPNIDLVVEYDPPFSADDHLHRIGRTARAGRAGRALIFLLPGDEEGYISILSASSKSLTGHGADDVLSKGFGGTGREWEERATEWQLDVERWALGEAATLEMARRAYQSHIRAYATHVAAERGIFNTQTLHLGHLAKAFALRDRPGSINVPGLRPGKPEKRRGGSEDKRETKTRGKEATADDSAAARMRKKMKEHANSAAEFNIG